MFVAKIIRHRHRFEHYLNEVIRGVEEEVHYKIIFSHADEKKKWEEWLEKYQGKYEWNKEENKVTENSKLPQLSEFEGEEICWCDVFSTFILNIANYSLHSTLSPFKGEIYTKI